MSGDKEQEISTGTKGGRNYGNIDEHLPTTDGSGTPITYQSGTLARMRPVKVTVMSA
jgi:hypothetical protein